MQSTVVELMALMYFLAQGAINFQAANGVDICSNVSFRVPFIDKGVHETQITVKTVHLHLNASLAKCLVFRPPKEQMG